MKNYDKKKMHLILLLKLKIELFPFSVRSIPLRKRLIKFVYCYIKCRVMVQIKKILDKLELSNIAEDERLLNRLVEKKDMK